MNLKLWLNELGTESDPAQQGWFRKKGKKRAQGPPDKSHTERGMVSPVGSSVGGSGWGVGWVWGQGGICISWLRQI